MKFLFYLLLVLLSNICFAQNIYSALHLNDSYEVHYQKPIKKIILKSIFYNSYSTEKQTEIIYLNNGYRVLSSERYNADEELIFKYENEFKDDSLTVKSITTRKIPLLGYEYTTSKFEYDLKKSLTKEIKMNNQNEVIQTVTYENDDRGNPTLLRLSNGGYGYEKVVYDYANNSYSSFIYNSDNELISTDENIWLNYNKRFKNQKNNEFGDTIEDNYFLFEYKYDKFGNWIKQIRYKKVGKNKVLNAEFSRKITYK